MDLLLVLTYYDIIFNASIRKIGFPYMRWNIFRVAKIPRVAVYRPDLQRFLARVMMRLNSFAHPMSFIMEIVFSCVRIEKGLPAIRLPQTRFLFPPNVPWPEDPRFGSSAGCQARRRSASASPCRDCRSLRSPLPQP
jgi:hypothetical protein